MNRFINLFQTILTAERILTSESDLEFYGRDWLKDYAPKPSLILLPQTIEEVQGIVRVAFEHKIALVPSGGRTGLSGGATATNGEVVVSLEKMNKVIDLDTVGRTLTCQAGCILINVQRAAEEAGLMFPVELPTNGSALIGGNIATNAGGIRVVRWGNIRNWVLGLKVVSGTGELFELNGALIKNNTGYALSSLFIGSEGTLGIIVEATLKLTSQPRNPQRALLAVRSQSEVLEVFSRVREKMGEILVFELMDQLSFDKVINHRALKSPLQAPAPAYALVEVEISDETSRQRFEEVIGELIELELVTDGVIAQSSKQADELLALRELISETLGQNYSVHKNDVSVTIPNVATFMENAKEVLAPHYPGCEIAIFGHVGDGNLHVNILKGPNMSDTEFRSYFSGGDSALFELVKSLKGSISAEHGIGLLKKPYLTFNRTPAEIDVMRQIKQIFDPAGIMNPGKVFDP